MSLQSQNDWTMDKSLQDVGYRLTAFPKEFERKLSDMIDKRYWGILLASLFLHLIVVAYMATHPPVRQVTDEEIKKIQKRFASLVLDQPVINETTKFTETVKAEAPDVPVKPKDMKRESKKSATTKRPAKRRRSATVEGRKAERATAAVQRRRTREQIQKAVSNQGILGLLTSTSDAARGSEVEDVLSQSTLNKNLDKALTGVSGLKRGTGTPGASGGKGRNVRASRATGGGGIDDLVEGLERTAVSGVSRSGDIAIGESESLLEDEEETKNRGARDIDAVAAIVKSHNAAIQYCYQRELKRNPNLRGKVVVRFIINPAGHVIEATILSSTLKNPRVERCILNRIKRWTDFGAIDPSKGNVAFRQVYSFGY